MILEYNAVFGPDKCISIPYENNFNRFDAHYSGKYFGASLSALNYIAEKKDIILLVVIVQVIMPISY